MKVHSYNIGKTWILATILALIIAGTTISGVVRTEQQFVQLNPFFEKKLFGVEFDYNPSIPKDQALLLMDDLIDKTTFTNTTDPYEDEDNIITLVGHENKDIRSAFIALEHVKRKQEIIIPIEWNSTVPFIKYLHHFSLPTGEDVIVGQDFLGMALKANGTGFNPEYYQLGYANVPAEFLEFIIPDSGNFSFDSTVETSVKIQESVRELQIDFTYYNLTYLFQSEVVKVNTIDSLASNLAENMIIVQFDKVTYSIKIRKYAHHGTSGVETISEIKMGNVMNLIINEALPVGIWKNSSEYLVDNKFKGVIDIDIKFSWYQGSDILKRLNLFSDIAFSLITSQNIGVLNSTQPIESVKVIIDNQEKTTTELAQYNFPVNDGINLDLNEQLLLSTKVKGRNFAIHREDSTGQISLIPMEVKIIALNQQKGFAGNTLFLEETSLLYELVAECVKRFIGTTEISTLQTHEIITKGDLALTSAQYIQDCQVKEWSGKQFIINLIQFAVKTSPSSSTNNNKGNITLVPIVPGILGLITTIIIVKQRKKAK